MIVRDVHQFIAILKRWQLLGEAAAANSAWLEGAQEDLGQQWEDLIKDRDLLLQKLEQRGYFERNKKLFPLP